MGVAHYLHIQMEDGTMFKKMVIVIGTVALVAALGLFAVGTASAQGPATGRNGNLGAPLSQAWGRVCQGAGVVSDAVSELLGLTPEEIHTQRSEGKTLAQIAEAQGIDDQQLIDAIVAGRQEAIAQAVEDGRMTQAQADWMLAKIKAMAPFQITNPFAPGENHGRMGGGMGGGMRGGGRGAWAAPAANQAQ
jgi:hypothetical protein